MIRGSILVAIAAAALAAEATRAAPPEPDAPLAGEAAVELLRTADVVSIRDLDTKGITRPQQAILSDGQRTLKALWKPFHEYAPVKEVARGRRIIRFRDTWRHEVAAYELDRLLGLGLVPPTVERTIDRETGALQLWIDDAITAWERYQDDIPPPDVVAWNNQMHAVRAFVQLTWDLDYNNLRNQLVGPDWHLWKIDSSRAFREDPELRKPESLKRFPRRLRETLREVDRDDLERRLGRWLESGQIDGLHARCLAMLDLIERRIAEHGESAVLFELEDTTAPDAPPPPAPGRPPAP